MKRTFLKAEWRKLLMANYEVDRKVLEPFLPNNTELDLWNDKCYVSLVGFMFVNTRIKGIKVPLHVNFEEVNLRFYVRYKDEGEWKRGVVFIREIVPKRMLTFVANTIYREKYKTLPMSHSWQFDEDNLQVEYKWRKQRDWHSMRIKTESQPMEIKVGSEEEFITEHYWGYTKINQRKTAEYGVEHPTWKVYNTLDFAIDVDFGENYGQEFNFLNSQLPKSVFLAEGSEIKVKSGRRI